MEYYSAYQDRIATVCKTKGPGQDTHQVKPSTVRGDLSPIMERLSLLLDEISHAHSNMSELEHRLTPVRAASPPGDQGESPEMAGPSEVEDRLTMAYNHVRGLNDRIAALRNELRI